MNTRNRNLTGSGSQPDLHSLRDKYDGPDLKVNFRNKRKHECDMKQEFDDFKNEIMAFLKNFSATQSENILQMQREIMSEIKDVKNTTEKIIEDQNKLKTEIQDVKNLTLATEAKVNVLQTDLNNTTRSPFNTQSETSLSSDEIFAEFQERHQRKNNIIITGIPESETSNQYDDNKNAVMEIIQTVYKDCPDPIKIFRLGKYDSTKTRPVKVRFESDQIAFNVLRNKSKIATAVKIYSDKTPYEQKYLKELKEELQIRKEKGEENLIIKYVKGIPKIIKSLPKNSN